MTEHRWTDDPALHPGSDHMRIWICSGCNLSVYSISEPSSIWDLNEGRAVVTFTRTVYTHIVGFSREERMDCVLPADCDLYLVSEMMSS